MSRSAVISDPHPRISQRRTEVAKTTSRRRSQVFFTLAFISIVALVLLIVMASPIFNVDEVKAAGYIRSDPVAIVEAANIEIGAQLSEIDTAGITERIVDSSAWISAARVDRSWDGTVTLYVTERQPVLALEGPGDVLVLVDELGYQLEVVSSLPEGVMAVSGLGANGQPGQPGPVAAVNVAAVAQALSPELLEMIDRLQIEDSMVLAVLHDQALINFGDANALTEKMVAVETLFARVDMRCLDEIDVRVPSSPSLTRRSRDGQTRAIVQDLDQCI